MQLRACAQCGSFTTGNEMVCRGCGAALEAADPGGLVGQALGKYEVLEVIGRGGMGIVFKGRHATLGHLVAIKLLRNDLADPTFAERFEREARLLASLRHPNIVEVHDFDVAPDGTPYYVMEYLEGETLSAELARSPQGLGWPRALLILRQVADALDAAHAHGVVHRDLKPDNVFIARDGSVERVKLIDFGIARPLNESETTASLTRAGHVVGTPRYFAPEQFYGFPVTTATDQYALALVVAEMASGSLLQRGAPFGEGALEGNGRMHDALLASLPPDTSPVALAALERALALDPAERHGNVVQFARAMGVTPGQPVEARVPEDAATRVVPVRPQPQPRPRPSEQRMPARRAAPDRRPLLAGGLLLAVLAGAVAWWAMRRTVPEPAPVAAAAEAVAWLRPLESRPVGEGAQRILGRRGDVAVLASADGWELQPVSGAGPATHVALPRNRQLLGALDGGELAVRDGDSLLAVDAFEGAARVLVRLPRAIATASVLWLAPDARTLVVAVQEGLAVYRVAAEGLQRLGTIPDTGARPQLALSRQWIAVAVPEAKRLRVYRSADARLVLGEALAVGTLRELRILDEPGRVAVAGSGPAVQVFALDASAPPRSLPVPGGAGALAWLPDFPSLLVVGEGGLGVWRGGDAPVALEPGAGLATGSLWADGSGVLALDNAAHRLHGLAYGGLATSAPVPLGAAAVTALRVAAQGGRILAGTGDGGIHAIAGTAVSTERLHGGSVLALAGDAGHLASASEDRTLAIWRLPDLSVQWRSRGEKALAPELHLQGAALWSATREGRLERWRWPTLEAEESVDLVARAGRGSFEIASFWIDEGATRALVGTRNRLLLSLERAAGKAWNVRAMPFPSARVERLVELPRVDAVLALGREPAAFFLLDRRSGTLHELRDFGMTPAELVADGGGAGAWAAGVGVVARWQFERGAGGEIRWHAALGYRSELGKVTALAHDGARHRLWIGTESGRLESVDTASWAWGSTYEGSLAAEPARR